MQSKIIYNKKADTSAVFFRRSRPTFPICMSDKPLDLNDASIFLISASKRCNIVQDIHFKENSHIKMQRTDTMQGSPDAKKPCKGILKTSSSFDKHSGSASHRKSAKFDELNVLQTYHPPDKDYGHMKIEEPKTPYNYNDPDLNNHDQLDAELLAEKLKVAADSRTSSNEESSEDEEETEEQRERRKEFEKRRKAHYNEFEAVKLARKLIEEEDDEDDEIKHSNRLPEEEDSDDSNKDGMDVEVMEDAQNTSPSSEH